MAQFRSGCVTLLMLLVIAAAIIGATYAIFRGMEWYQNQQAGGPVSPAVATPLTFPTSPTAATQTPFAPPTVASPAATATIASAPPATPAPPGSGATVGPTVRPQRTATPTPVAPAPQGTSLTLFVEPDAKHQPILDAINGAKRSIDMVMYLLTDDKITTALIAAQRRGVKVRVMTEPSPFGGGGSDEDVDKLKRAGVQTKDGNPTFRFTHQKTMIIDGRTALILTPNMTAAAFSRNRGYGIIDTDLARVAEIAAVFDADWNRVQPRVAHPDLVWSPVNSREKLMALLRSARRTVEIEAEVMQDAETINILIGLAQQGVAVRVVMSPPEPGTTSERGLFMLENGGVQVRRIKSPYIHAKMVVVDGARGWIGSVNFSDNSMDNNRELGILVRDAAILNTLRATFEKDWVDN